jgi:hypothetical protein
MGTSYRFIADPEQSEVVLRWFRSRTPPPHEIDGDGCLWLHFSEEGPLIEPDRSPLATVYLPRVRRRAIWTVGELHFLPTRDQFPGLRKTSGEFAKQIEKQPCVFSNEPEFEGEFDDYLEGSVRNYDTPIYAFPSGLRALQQGCYFVAENDTRARLDDLCKVLRLRGIDCGD